MTAIDSKSYLPYLNIKMVDQYNNTYHSSNKKPDYSALTEKIEINHRAPKSKVNDRIRVKVSKYF